MADTISALSISAAGVSLLDNIVKMIQNARYENTELSMADVVKKLPSEAHALAGQIIKKIEDFERLCVQERISFDRSVAELEADTSFWRLRKYRIVRRFATEMYSLYQQIGHLLEDFIAVIHCAEQEDIISISHIEVRKRKSQVRQIILSDDIPIRQIFKELHEEADRLRTELWDLRSKIEN